MERDSSELYTGHTCDWNCGAHASLLPHNRGSAPINRALINGEQVTGNMMMWLSQASDIIDQIEIPISIYDTCKTLYNEVAETNAKMLVKLLNNLQKGIRPLSSIKIFPANQFCRGADLRMV